MEEIGWIGEVAKIITQNYPTLGFALLMAFLFKKPITEISVATADKMVNYFLKRTNRETVRIIKLEHHPYFTFMQECLNRRIPAIYFDNKTKSIVLKEFLKVQVKTFAENFLKFVKTADLASLDRDEFRSTIMALFNESIVQYTELAVTKFDELGIERETSRYILSKFNEAHATTLDIMQMNIADICDSDYQPNMNYRMKDVLFMLKIGFELTMKDGIKAFLAINGRVENLTLKV